MRIENAADRKDRPGHGKWATSWAAAMQGPAPSGVPSALPDMTLALPGFEARDQTFRMIFQPSLWGRLGRLRFSNAFGDRPVAIDGVFVGLHAGAGAVLPGSSVPVRFGGGDAVTLPSGGEVLSDPFELALVQSGNAPELVGRRLAASFHVVGPTGPLTWHAKAMTTSYISPPGSGAVGDAASEAAFPFSTTAWHFLDGFDIAASDETAVIAALGDSITDGTFSTLNGDDRWTDRLIRRLRAAGVPAAVANVGIGGNQVVGPAAYPPAFEGGPSALQRLERDVLSRAGISHVIWAEGVNDFGQAFAPPGTPSATAEAVIAGLQQGVARMRAAGIVAIGGTLPPSLNATREIYGTAETDRRRRQVNAFIRSPGAFDAVVDFEAATLDPETGEIKAAYQPDSTLGLSPDRLHPNRAGYLAMGDAVDLAIFGG